MTYNPGKTPPFVTPVQQSDYEEALVPNRSVMNTQPYVDSLTQNTQQGTVATSTNNKTNYAGIDPIFVSGHRWF